MLMTMTYRTSLARQIISWTCSRASGGGYCGEPSVFDKIGKDDLVMAFFPCIRFSKLAVLHLQGNAAQVKDKSALEKVEYSMKFNEELNALYQLFGKMVAICLKRGIRIIIENPYDEQHYLKRYFPVLPKVVDTDRTKRGDYYKKPTQYFFINCEPENNFIFEPLQLVEHRRIDKISSIDGIGTTTLRSMIHPQYANRFIREQILDEEEHNG